MIQIELFVPDIRMKEGHSDFEFIHARSEQVAMDDYYDFEIVNTISTADWILLLLIISSWLFLEKNIYY